MTKPNRFPLLLLLIAISLLGAAIVALMMRPTAPVTQASLVGGPFTLTADDGRGVSDADFKGHPFLIFFGYTHCPDVCPTELYEISQVLKELGPDTKVKALFVTVDPTRDTPDVMKSYLANFDPHIIGLSGTESQTKAIEHAYRVYAKKVPEQGGGYSMDHTAIVYLMDKNANFVSAFNLDRPAKVAAAELQKYF
jgi:protein SCO1